MIHIKIRILAFVSIIRIEKNHQFNLYFTKKRKNKKFPSFFNRKDKKWIKKINKIKNSNQMRLPTIRNHQTIHNQANPPNLSLIFDSFYFLQFYYKNTAKS